jgi:transcriptional regulator with XRE-family HTH domain
MDSVRASLIREFRDPEARRDYAEEFLNSCIALQIKTLRLQRGWSQKDLAERAGMKQSRISAMEQADYSGWSVTTLRRIAEAFDLALVVRFESYGTFLKDVTSASREALERPSFPDDPEFQEEAPVIHRRRSG